MPGVEMWSSLISIALVTLDVRLSDSREERGDWVRGGVLSGLR